MKKTFVLGLMALALVIGLTGCPFTSKLLVQDTPVEQRAVLYLYDEDCKIMKVDDGWMTNKGWEWFPPFRGAGTPYKGQGNSKITRSWTMKPNIEVPPGEHKLSMNKKSIYIGTRDFETTYVFEAGKKYFVTVTTDPKLTILEQAGKLFKEELIVLIVPFTGTPVKSGSKIGDTIIPTSAEADALQKLVDDTFGGK